MPWLTYKDGVGSVKSTVSLEGVSLKFGSRVALDNITLRVPIGVTGVIGINGAGKSTLLNLLATLTKPTAGEVTWFEGSPVRAARRHISLMPQDFTVPSGFRTAEYVQYVAWLRGVSRSDVRSAAATALEAVGLADRGTERMRGLSGGMLRRVALAQAIVSKPRLLLLDEPTTNLDPEQRMIMRELIRALADQGGSTVIASHLVEDIIQLCDQVLIMRDGRQVGLIDRAELRARLAELDAHPERSIVKLMTGAAGL